MKINLKSGITQNEPFKYYHLFYVSIYFDPKVFYDQLAQLDHPQVFSSLVCLQTANNALDALGQT